MKKTKFIVLGILAATAIACDEDQTEEIKHCVDSTGVVVDESLCNPAGDAGVATSTDDAGHVVYVPNGYSGGNSGIYPFFFYHWYYGGYSSPQSIGTRIIVNGNGYGRWTAPVGRSYSTPSSFGKSSGSSGFSIGKGGFGSTGRGFGGGSGS